MIPRIDDWEFLSGTPGILSKGYPYQEGLILSEDGTDGTQTNVSPMSKLQLWIGLRRQAGNKLFELLPVGVRDLCHCMVLRFEVRVRHWMHP